MARPPIPPLDVAFGFGPALLVVAMAAAAWWVGPPHGALFLLGGQLWAAAILLFLAGVRRGLSFSTAGGPRPAQVATSIGLFVLGLAALVTPFGWSLVVLATGYAAVGMLDPLAARAGEVPAHFARLRPPQMAVFLLGLLGLFWVAAAR